MNDARTADMAGALVTLAPELTRGERVQTAMFLVVGFLVLAVCILLAQGLVGRLRREGVSALWRKFSFAHLLLLGAVGVAGYLVTATMNPEVQVRASDTVLHPGQEVRVAWKIGGAGDPSVRKIAAVRVALVGFEQWTTSTSNRDGTSRTDTHSRDLLRLPFASPSGGAPPTHGSASLIVPADAPVTGRVPNGSNRKILWQVQVRAEVARWTDLAENFPVTVTAAH